MKKVLALICGVILIFTLAGCGDNASGEEGNSSSVNTNENVQQTEKHKNKGYDSIEITADVGAVTITTGDEFSLRTRNINEAWLKTEEDGKKSYKVTYSPDVSTSSQAGGSTHELILTIPEDDCPEEIIITMGAGYLKANGLKCENIRINQSAGAVKINGLTADTGDFRCGAGYFNVENLKIEDKLDITGGMGYCDVSGEFGEDITINGGVGAMRLDMAGSRDDYAITANTPTRVLYVDHSVYNSTDEDTDSSKGKITVDGGIGRIDINFAG